MPMFTKIICAIRAILLPEGVQVCTIQIRMLTGGEYFRSITRIDRVNIKKSRTQIIVRNSFLYKKYKCKRRFDVLDTASQYKEESIDIYIYIYINTSRKRNSERVSFRTICT